MKYKNRLFSIALALLMLFSLAAVLPMPSAQAAGVTVTASANPSSLTSAGKVTITLDIVNNTSSAVTINSVSGPGYNNNASVDLEAGQGLNDISFDYNVKDAELGKALTYTVTYNGSSTATGSVTITKQQQTASIDWSRTVSKTTVASGSQVTITYTVRNTGTAPLSNITITDPITSEKITWNSLAANQQVRKQVTVTISRETVTQPTIAYTANGQQKTERKDAVKITTADTSLEISAKADKTEISPGDKVTFTITLTSKSAADINGINIVDEKGNEVRKDAKVTGNKQATFTYEMMPDSTRDVQFTATYPGGTVKSNSVAVTVAGTTAEKLELQVTPSATNIEMPGQVTFSISVKNTSGGEIRDIVISEKSFGELGKISALAHGKSESIMDVTKDITEAGTYTFEVEGTDASGAKITSHTVVAITDANATTPTPTQPKDGDTLGTLFVILIVIIVLIVIAGITLAVLTIRERRKNEGKDGKDGKGGPPKGPTPGGPNGGRAKKNLPPKNRDSARRVDLYEDQDGMYQPSLQQGMAREDEDVKIYQGNLSQPHNLDQTTEFRMSEQELAESRETLRRAATGEAALLQEDMTLEDELEPHPLRREQHAQRPLRREHEERERAQHDPNPFAGMEEEEDDFLPRRTKR